MSRLLRRLWRRLFPPPDYDAPDDFGFYGASVRRVESGQ